MTSERAWPDRLWWPDAFIGEARRWRLAYDYFLSSIVEPRCCDFGPRWPGAGMAWRTDVVEEDRQQEQRSHAAVSTMARDFVHTFGLPY